VQGSESKNAEVKKLLQNSSWKVPEVDNYRAMKGKT